MPQLSDIIKGNFINAKEIDNLIEINIDLSLRYLEQVSDDHSSKKDIGDTIRILGLIEECAIINTQEIK